LLDTRLKHVDLKDPKSKQTNPFRHLDIEGFDLLLPQMTEILQKSSLISPDERTLIEAYSSLNSRGDDTPDLVAAMKTTLESLAKTTTKADVAKSAQKLDCVYLANSDQMLIWQGDQIKLVARGRDGFTAPIAFREPLTSLGQATVLEASSEDVEHVLATLDFTLVDEKRVVSNFLSHVAEKGLASIPFLLGVLGVKALLRAAVWQFKQTEDQLKRTEAALMTY
jgi:hypothetical protein